MKLNWQKYWAVIKPYVVRAADFATQQWKRFESWYMNQQEVVKKRSEISHERITVKRAVLAFMETWGLGSRNIFYAAWHLIWRPGFMMSDYLNGDRKRYLQPFFMFFVLTLILVQMAYLLDVDLPKNRTMTLMTFDFLTVHRDWFSVAQQTTILNIARWWDTIHEWRNVNRGWDLMIHSLSITLISWLLWRKSPRIGSAQWAVENGTVVTGYNFAEIVTVIAYILCQLQLLSMVTMIFFRKLPFDHIYSFSLGPSLILFVILLIDFKQLFQRSWWDTVWRTAIITAVI